MKDVSVEPNPSARASTELSRTSSGRRRRLPLLLLLFLLLFLAFCIFAVVMRLRDPNITLWKLLNLRNLSILPKKSVIIPRPAKLLTDQKVTKKILAKDGGEVEVVSANGYTYRITVAPGVLRSDVTIDLTPLEEAPFEYPPDTSGQPADPPPDPGVDVTVDPPQPPQPPQPPNPPEPPDEPPVDPTDRDTGIELYIFPPGFGRRTMQTGGDPGQQAADLMAGLGLGNLSMFISPSPTPQNAQPAEPKKPAPGESTGKTPDVIVLIPRDGRPRIRIPSPVWASNGHTEPPDGGGTDVPEGGGTATPDGTENGKGDDQVDQAAANSGGRCSPEFINAVANVYGSAGRAGNVDATNRYSGVLEECEEEIIGYIKRLCQSDRRLLRRVDFTTARKLLGLAHAGLDRFTEVATLEQQCKGSYTITDHGEAPGSGTAGVTMEGTIDASVCGYFDDLWDGTTTYTLRVSGAAVHTYEGTETFRLPARGGSFSAADTSGVHNFMAVPGAPLPDLGFTGSFDSQYTVDVVIYPAISLKIEIPLVSTECSEAPPFIPAAQ